MTNLISVGRHLITYVITTLKMYGKHALTLETVFRSLLEVV